jgi:hypothetical protein
MKQLIYGGEILSEEDYDSMLEKIDDFPRDVQHGCRKPSLYLQLFEGNEEVLFETRKLGADMSRSNRYDKHGIRARVPSAVTKRMGRVCHVEILLLCV